MFGVSIHNKDNRHELILAIGLLIILVVRDVFGININKYIIISFVTMVMLNASIPSLIAMLSFCFPLFCGLPGKYIIIIAFALILWKANFRLNKHQIICSSFIIIMETIASIWYPSPPELMESIGYMLFAITMFWMLWTEEELDHKQCLRFFLLGDAILCGIIIVAGIKTAPSNWINMFSAGKFRFGNTQVEKIGENMTLWLNPNGLAYFSIVGISIALALIEKEKRKNLFSNLVIIILCGMAGFLTQSRSWLICVMIIAALYIMGKMVSVKSFISISIMLILFSYLVFLYFNQNPELVKGLETRLTSSDVATGDGRVYLFQKYMEVFGESFRFQLMGTGVMQVRAVTGIFRNGMHNSLQQMLVCYGIPGCIFMIYHLFTPILRTTKGRKIKILYWLPLLSVILFTQTIQFIHPYIYMPPFAVSAYSLLLNRNENEKQSELWGKIDSDLFTERRIKNK